MVMLHSFGWLITKSKGFTITTTRRTINNHVISSSPSSTIHNSRTTTSRIGRSSTRQYYYNNNNNNHNNIFRHGQSIIRFASSSSQTDDNDDRLSSEENNNKKSTNKKKSTKKQKIVVKDITDENMEKLAAAFDELAKKDGFDSSMSRMAVDSTFEDDFEIDDFLDDDDDDDDDEELVDVDLSKITQKDELDNLLDETNFDLSDFVEGEDDNEEELSMNFDDEDEDDDYLDFGGDDDDDMEARIAQARKDMVRGQVSVPDDLDRFVNDATEDELARLGFQKEENFYGNDETRRKNQFTLVSNAMTCSACGSDFQSRDEKKPGFLPKEKFDIQVNLSKIEEMQQLKKKAESFEWSPEDEIEYLIQTSGKGELDSNNEPTDAADIDIDAMAEEMGLDLVKVSQKKVICKRCHGLQNSGKVDDSLRPGWTDEPTMSQEQFRELLRPISEKPAVIIALVDLFDFGGSVLKELDGIAGDNPVILAANKADLMPSKMGTARVENWVRRELEYMGVRSIANVGGAVRLVSCKTGEGVADMMKKARELAEDLDGDVYVVGAANAGKSTLINYILSRDQEKPTGKIRAGNRNQFKGALTTSPLPGTTLKFIKIDLGEGRSLYDTPGLLVPGTMTQLLTPEELKIVCPSK